MAGTNFTYTEFSAGDAIVASETNANNSAIDTAFSQTLNGTKTHSALNVSGSSALAGTTITGAATVSGNFTVDTTTLHVDAANNRVGVGTTAPRVQLDLAAAAGEGDREAIRISADGGGGSTQGKVYMGLAPWNTGTYPAARIGAEETDVADYGASIVFQTRDSEADVAPTTKVAITEAGNVGIGTSSPLGDLDIHGNSLSMIFSSPSDTNRYRIDANITDAADYGLSIGYWDGSAYQRTLTVDDSGQVGIGTTSPTQKLSVTGSISVTGALIGSVTGNVTGNASTATQLQTARTIGGVSFNGTANINLPGVNTTGNQSTTGNAATATTLQTARTINGVSFNGSANITVAAAAGTLTGSTLKSTVTASSLTSVGTLGSLTTSGNVNCGAVLRSTLSVGDEGGEIFLAAPANGGLSAVIDNYYLSGSAISTIRMGSACMLPNDSGGVYSYDTGSEGGASAERQVYVNNGLKSLGTAASTLAVKTNVSELTADGVSDGHPDDTRTLLERARSLNSIRFEYISRANQGLRYNLGFGAEHVEDLFPEATRAYQEEDGSVSGYDDRSMIAILWALWRDADERLQALEV